MPEATSKSSKSDQSKSESETKAAAQEPVAPKEPETTDDSSEPTFTVERLSKEGRAITGHKPADIAGAFHGVASDKEFTAQAASDRVDKWLGTTVSE